MAAVLIAAVDASFWRDLARGLMARGWPTVRGEVTHCHSVIEPAGRGDWAYRPLVVYEYRVGGHLYEGRRVFFGYDTFYTARGLRKHLAGYSRGQQVDVRYDPRDPSRCVLEPGVNMRTWLVTFGGAAAVIFMEYALLFH